MRRGHRDRARSVPCAASDFARARHSTQASASDGTAQSIMLTPAGHDARQHPRGDRQEHHAEQILDGSIHAPARGSSFAGRSADQQQRRAHAEARSTNSATRAAHHVAGLADEGQRAR